MALLRIEFKDPSGERNLFGPKGNERVFLSSQWLKVRVNDIEYVNSTIAATKNSVGLPTVKGDVVVWETASKMVVFEDVGRITIEAQSE